MPAPAIAPIVARIAQAALPGLIEGVVQAGVGLAAQRLMGGGQSQQRQGGAIAGLGGRVTTPAQGRGFFPTYAGSMLSGGPIAPWNMKRVIGALKEDFRELGRQVSQASPEVGRVGTMLNETAAAARDVTTRFGGVITGAIRFTNALNQLSSQAIESQRQFARYSGTGAASLAQLDVGRILRDIRTAQGTAGSFGALTRSRNEFEEALRPFRELAINLQNTVFAGLLSVGAKVISFIDAMEPFTESAAELMEWLRKRFGIAEPPDTGDTWSRFLDDATEALKSHTPPPRPKL